MTFTELAKLVSAHEFGTSAQPSGEGHLNHVSSLSKANSTSVVFAVDASSLERARASGAGAILSPASLAMESAGDSRLLPVRDPKLAFARCAQAFAALAKTSNVETDGVEPAVHPTAVVHPSAMLGAGTRVAAGVVIGRHARLGSDCFIGPNVTIGERVWLGDRVSVQAGAVLGATGFGYVFDRERGEHVLFPQQGDLAIEDDVEIGANTTVDRGALEETRIGAGTKIDNQVHIGHNCIIGRNVLIAAQVGISGSCIVGDGAVLAGQVGLSDHVSIGPGVILGGAAGVFSHKRLEGAGEIFMGVPAVPLKVYLRTMAKVRRES